ncbi:MULTISPECIES: ATP-dependent DNA helicase RecG [unclassified Agrococcus]|uniref:ATP-dependent DNA helicase RecG n=1 Tax=unclassified Agrococcus TaxID=2615065 RepID=UPI00361EC66D
MTDRSADATPGGVPDGAVPDGLERSLRIAVGQKTADRLKRAFGYERVGDLVMHVPRRYVQRGQLTDLSALQIGDHVTVVAEVRAVGTRETGRRDRRGRPLVVTTVDISDGARDTLQLTFFNQRWIEGQLRKGVTAMFSGTVGAYRDQRQLTHPEFEPFEDEGADPAAWADEVIPVYPATATLPSKDLRALIQQVLADLGPIDDPVPDDVRAAHRLLPLRTALERIHAPESEAAGHAAMHTLRWHEAFLLETYLLATRAWMQSLPSTPRVAGALLERLDASLPYELTPDQQAVGDEVQADLAARTSMHRLVQGEVGSGKTLVAIRAMLAVAESGGQSALLAPTEVLASQHLRSIVATLGPDLAAELHPVLLTGQMPAAEQRRALLAIAAGQSRIVVGTHALLSDRVQFVDLGLVVIDEQHRFGVEQRETLRQKGVAPHTLVLTATPIPRTIAMTAFGDLDVSTIRTLPPGRSPIQTHVVGPEASRAVDQRIWHRVAEEVAKGRQAFVVCPAIAPGDVEGGMPEDDEGEGRPPLADVETWTRMLRTHPGLQGTRVESLTGAMASDEKDAVMRAVVANEVGVVVATTVIEVGVDVPNATTMVVLDADRFGVSQLHQLRGRVGRGAHAGLCLLRTAAQPETPARERVDAVAATLDGFALAEIDLEHRREGDVLGTTQSGGRSSLRLLRVTRDRGVIEAAREAALAVLADDPRLERRRALRLAVHRRLDPDARAALTSA